MQHFKKILEFQKLLKKFNQIYRDLGSLRECKDRDNDVEHSYRVAMLAWMVVEEYKLKLDVNKVIKYSMIHDLVEVYAGDVSIYKNNPKSQKTKELREHKALLRLKKEFPKLKSFWKIIDDYEKREDEESKFVYVIEKLEPTLVIILSDKKHFLKRRVSIVEYIERKQKKLKSVDSFAQMFNHEITEFLKKNNRKFFV